MIEIPAHHPKNLLNCEVCMKEIPASVAKSVEAEDYVHHFCGADCFDKWLKKERDYVKTGND